MYQTIQVIYQNDYEGAVDDVTLNELISANRIRKFYRPSESRWVDVYLDSIRTQARRFRGPEKRQFREDRQEPKPDGLLAKFLKRRTRTLTAQDWLEKGFALLYNKTNYYEAMRAFALSIQLDPSNARAYLSRGIAYERMNNAQQAFEDYSRAIHLAPQDAKVYYMRAMLLRHGGKDSEAMADLKVSADLGYKLAIDFLKQKGIVG